MTHPPHPNPLPPLPPWTLNVPPEWRWFVLHTKSRQEKALAETLTAQGVQHFLPLKRQNRRHGGRKVQLDLPLFPGYVFLLGTHEHAYEADRTRRVAGIIPVIDQQALAEELRSLYVTLTHDLPLDPYPYLKKNVKVQVTAGPLRGVRGVIESRTKRDRLILQINVLGQATSLEIDGSLLEVID